jgi:flagellar protein FliS
MDQRLRDYYIETQVNTATPGQMLLMLYDCLIERAECADRHLSVPDELAQRSSAAHEVSRCINILTELNGCLRRSVQPSLCAALSDLYLFFMRQFSLALETRQPEKIRQILPLIRKLRETWAEANKVTHGGEPASIAVAA